MKNRYYTYFPDFFVMQDLLRKEIFLLLIHTQNQQSLVLLFQYQLPYRAPRKSQVQYHCHKHLRLAFNPVILGLETRLQNNRYRITQVVTLCFGNRMLEPFHSHLGLPLLNLTSSMGLLREPGEFLQANAGSSSDFHDVNRSALNKITCLLFHLKKLC